MHLSRLWGRETGRELISTLKLQHFLLLRVSQNWNWLKALEFVKILLSPRTNLISPVDFDLNQK